MTSHFFGKKFAAIFFLFTFSFSQLCTCTLGYAAAIQPPAPGSQSAKAQAPAATQPALSDSDRQYLTAVYQDIWKFLSTFVDPKTGIPYDSDKKNPATSLSNVGLYFAAVTTAYQTGLIGKDEAVQRISAALASVRKVENWLGFPRVWFTARGLKPISGTEVFSYTKHLSNLIGGLIVAKNVFPEELGDDIGSYLRTMKFKNLYDAKTGWIRGGYNVKDNNFAIGQPFGNWYYKYFASEVRLISFYLIARGFAPASHWNALIRPVQKTANEWYFVPGYEDGGAFMPYLAGFFIDERNSLMGMSQKNYSLYQMNHAQKIGAPVWGWSSSLNPQGEYVPYGELKDEVVAPYASMLAANYLPSEVAKNLQKLEEMGARPEVEIDLGKAVPALADDAVNPKLIWANSGNGDVFFMGANKTLDKLSIYIDNSAKGTPLTVYDKNALKKLLEAMGYVSSPSADALSYVNQISSGSILKDDLLKTFLTDDQLGKLISLAIHSRLYSPAQISLRDGKTYNIIFRQEGSVVLPWAIATPSEIFFINPVGSVEKFSIYADRFSDEKVPSYSPTPLNEVVKNLGYDLSIKKLEDIISAILAAAPVREGFFNLINHPVHQGHLLGLAYLAGLSKPAMIQFVDGKTSPIILDTPPFPAKPWAVANNSDIFFINQNGKIEKLSTYVNASKSGSVPEAYDQEALRQLLIPLGYKINPSLPITDVITEITQGSTLNEKALRKRLNESQIIELVPLAYSSKLLAPGSIKFADGKTGCVLFAQLGSLLKPWAVLLGEEIVFLNSSNNIEHLSSWLKENDPNAKIGSYDDPRMNSLLLFSGYAAKEGVLPTADISSVSRGSLFPDQVLRLVADSYKSGEILGLAALANKYQSSSLKLTDNNSIPALFYNPKVSLAPWAVASGSDVHFLQNGNFEKISNFIDTTKAGSTVETYDEDSLKKLLEALGLTIREGDSASQWVKEIVWGATLKEDLLKIYFSQEQIIRLAGLAGESKAFTLGAIKLKNGEVIPALLKDDIISITPWAVSGANDVYFLNNLGLVEKLSRHVDSTKKPVLVSDYDAERVKSFFEPSGITLKENETIESSVSGIVRGTVFRPSLEKELSNPTQIAELMALAAASGHFSSGAIKFTDIQLTSFGFRDSIDWKTGEISEHYLTPSQGMGFLSLANLLYDGVVWKSFSKDAAIAKASHLLQITPEDKAWIEKQTDCLCKI